MFQPGQYIGDYKLLYFLDQGAMGKVWKAEDKEGKHWALKIFGNQIGLDTETRTEVKNTYNRNKNLLHPNIRVASDYGEYAKCPFLVLPYCDSSLGKELAERIKANYQDSGSDTGGLFPEMELVKIMTDIANGLGYLHSNYINRAHLDIKPANVLIRTENDEQIYLVSDFDISIDLKKTILKQTQTSRTNVSGFSPAYAAPEQFERNYQGTVKSDIFSLGVMLYELAAGELPSENTPIGVLLQNGVAVPEVPGDYSAQFKQIIRACMHPDPNERPTAKLLQSWGLFYLSEKYWTQSITFDTQEAKVATTNWGSKLAVAAGLMLLVFGGLGWYFLNQKSGVEPLQPLQSSLVTPNHELLINQNAAGEWGYTNRKGEVIIPHQFSAVSDFKGNYAAVIKGDQAGFIDRTGKAIIMRPHEGTARIISEYIGKIKDTCFDLQTGKTTNC